MSSSQLQDAGSIYQKSQYLYTCNEESKNKILKFCLQCHQSIFKIFWIIFNKRVIKLIP